MAGQSFEVESIAEVISGRIEPTDDYWGGTRSIILWVPNRSSSSCGLGIFVDQPTEPIVTSEVKLW